MFYSLYDAGYAASIPARLALAWTAAARDIWSATPFAPYARYASASARVWSGLLRRRGKPAWNIAPIACGSERVMVEQLLAASHPFCDLVRFVRADAVGDNARDDARITLPKVLLVAPLSGHYATLLRDTVQTLVEDFDVYVTDWANASLVPLSAGTFDLDAYAGELLAFLRALGPDVHVLAVCQPGPLVITAVALLAANDDCAQPRSMTLMGAPIDTRVAPTGPTRLAESKSLSWFERTLIDVVPAWYPGAGRRVYPGHVQLSAFVAMNPDRHAIAQIEMVEELVRGDRMSAAAKEAFYDEYFSVLDMDAAYYLQTVERIFQTHDLPRGRMTWHGELVRPQTIRQTALFTIEGERDDISAPGQTFAAHAICSGLPDSKREHYVQPEVGHYGIFSGRRWREEIAPRFAAFVRANA